MKNVSKFKKSTNFEKTASAFYVLGHVNASDRHSTPPKRHLHVFYWIFLFHISIFRHTIQRAYSITLILRDQLSCNCRHYCYPLFYQTLSNILSKNVEPTFSENHQCSRTFNIFSRSVKAAPFLHHQFNEVTFHNT